MKIVKNEWDPPLFTGKLLIKFQNILRNTTQVIIRHSSLPVKRGGSLSFLVGTISNVLVMEIGWTDVGNGGYILVSCAHSNTSYFLEMIMMYAKSETLLQDTLLELHVPKLDQQGYL